MGPTTILLLAPMPSPFSAPAEPTWRPNPVLLAPPPPAPAPHAPTTSTGHKLSSTCCGRPLPLSCLQPATIASPPPLKALPLQQCSPESSAPDSLNLEILHHCQSFAAQDPSPKRCSPESAAPGSLNPEISNQNPETLK
ncbi:hypothetical protein PVAP13_2KG176501 [Panicum virgatum]|uniref:Uncharacterized protein n=1 Tax=Panicum virgatum TaxID=38727 RepID=A0A8T0WIG0_PANVG|nr:hypothetical protein PVAP13_2KG176501 [Panicum virgatum]